MKNLSILLSEETEGVEVLQEKESCYQSSFTVEHTAETKQFFIQTNAPFQTKFNSDEQRRSYQDYLVNPRQIAESKDYPTLHSNHTWFDALYALALDEVRQCSVSEIKNNAYCNGQGIPAPEGGYFETGLFWTYIWTRDISYAVHLSLATLDPIRSLNSLNFKLSEIRAGGNQQIIQDTGTGGSYPISSDRVVWSFGCQALLQQLQGETRKDFARCAYAALKNTIEQDRHVIFDCQDGLYRGEQSFLDWREQSYPQWMAEDPVKIGMSKALSTNCCHFNALQLAASLAGELGHNSEQIKYSQWAQDLGQAIRTHLYLPESKLYSSFITTTFAPGAAHQYDLLGNALAILLDIAEETQADQIVSNYPHFPKGAAVIFPQQRDTLIYHNQAIWPFVTAYWLRAAKKVGNAQVVSLGMSSLVRGAALSLSNMENFDAVSGRVELDTEPKEPPVNSPRQLWSVAGYLSMIYDIIFGLSWTDSGIHISPYITREFRNYLLPKSNKLVLNEFPYKSHKLNITVHLPPVTEQIEGAYAVEEIRLNGQRVTSDITEAMLDKISNIIEVDLEEADSKNNSINIVGNLEDYRYRFAPRPPIIESITAIENQLEIKFNLNGENPDEVTVNIYRDGQLMARGLSGHLTTWRDPNSEGRRSPSYCYNLETIYTNTGTISQRSHPCCYWGANNHRIYSINADQFSAIGGQLSERHGRQHLENWGESGHRITVQIKAQFSGAHAIQVVAGNGAGSINTGITCGVKHLQMTNSQNNQVVADGYLIMPHLGTWDRWLESSVIFTQVDLIANQNYEINIFGDEQAINMSSFAHNANYTGGNGGHSGPYNYVNIAQIKLAALS
ncbi:MAG: hypothetical protein RH949_21660 [Coleofasciculus sp. A1-SPW-01]|uniref:alpha-L-rhamnosidase-related protein n=1 Tax=Coleofasciculus sp. A1-SPW-01 TaxID=3070819 RepID=UPI0032FC3952